MFEKILKSRTVWVILATFVFAGFEGVREFIPVALQVYVYGGLGLLATYFKIHPSQSYGDEAE